MRTLFLMKIILMVEFSYCQNLIHNPSFEDGASSPQCPYNEYLSTHTFDTDIYWWKIAYSNVDPLNNAELARNTPDWIDMYCGSSLMNFQWFLCNDFLQDNNSAHPFYTHRAVVIRAYYYAPYPEKKRFTNEAIRIGLDNDLVPGEVYILKMKLKPCQRYDPGVHNYYWGVNNLRVHFTTWGEHWNSDNSSNNSKWNDVTCVSTNCTYYSIGDNCSSWQYFSIELPPVPTTNNPLRNLILYVEEGAFVIDDVELYQKCSDYMLIENFHQTNGQTSYNVSNYIIAGYDVGSETTNGSILITNNANVEYVAGQSITLKSGFHAGGFSTGSFHAYITPCVNNKSYFFSNDSIAISDESILLDSIYDISKYYFKVYPNPNNGVFTIYRFGNIDRTDQLEIINMLGNSVYKSDFNDIQETIDISDYPKGLYVVVIKSLNELFVEKIVLQ